MRNLLITLLLLLPGLTSLAQATGEELKEEYIEKIMKTMKKKNIVGASLALVSSDSILWIKNFGYENKEAERKASEHTIFATGSVTKVFTAMAVMQLHEQNKLNVYKPLKNYLPQFDIKGEHAEKVTPYNIMMHHSGLPSDIMKGMFTHQPENYKAVVEYMNREYMAEEPEKIRAYSNPGYTLLGHTIYEVTGSEYMDVVESRITKPLAMNNSGFGANQPLGRTYNSKGEYKQDVKIRDIPAGGLKSTTSDMTKFLQAYLKKDERLLTCETFDQILQAQEIGSDLNMKERYALGWNMKTRSYAGDLFLHTGTTLYSNAMIGLAPEADLAVVLLTNSENGGSLFSSMTSLLDDFAKLEGATKKDPVYDYDFSSKKRIDVNAETLSQHTGIYATPGAYIKVYNKKNKLLMRIQGLKAELIPVGGGQYIPKIKLLGFIPIRLNESRMAFEEIEGHTLLTQVEVKSHKEILAEKVEPYSIESSWKSRLGSYAILDALPGEIQFFNDFRLIEKDGLLIIAFKQTTNGQDLEMVLDIVDDKRAKIAGIGRYAGQSVIVDKDKLQFFGITLKKNDHEKTK